jgi:RimJ/RimL family protein N-acetyltransferase
LKGAIQVFNYHLQAALADQRRDELRADTRPGRWPGPDLPPPATPAVRRRPLRRLAGRVAGWVLAGGRLSGATGPRSWPRDPANGRQTVLRDGSEVLIRPIQGADAPALADGFARLSLRSRQMRFLTPKAELSAAELRYLTEIDHHDHEALGAVDHAVGNGVGVARYVRSAEDARSAEIAVTVVDEWQGRGLGTELVAQLSERALAEGIRRFTGLAAADNVAVARLARNIGADPVETEAATVTYEISLVPGDKPGRARGGEPGRAPWEESRRAPWEESRYVPGDGPGRVPGDEPGRVPGEEAGRVSGEEPDHADGLTCPVGETRREATRVFQRPQGLSRGQAP